MQQAPTDGGRVSEKKGAPRRRRTQAERTSDMRSRISQATLETLCDVGFDRLSVAMVAARAGISKGAITHHFQTKADILVGAFEHMIAEWQQGGIAFRATYHRATLEDYLRFIWNQVFNRPTYIAAIDLMLAARADPALQRRLRAVLADWMILRDLHSEEVIGPDVAGIPRAIYLQLSLSMMRGMAIHESINVDDQINEVLMNTWIGITKRLLEGGQEITSSDIDGYSKRRVRTPSR